MSRAVHLQKHLYDLTERERLSKLHNWELLQQFEDAQKTLKKMLDRIAAMKKLRKEYERYLWSCSHQDNQLHLKAQTTQENMPRGHQMTCQKNSETSYTLLSHGLGKMPRTTGAYHGETFPPELQPSWQTVAQKQTAVFPNQASEQRWDITQSSPLSFPHSYLVGSHHLPSTHSLQPSASLQTSPSTDHPGLSLSKQCLSDCNASDQHYTHHSNPQSQRERVPKQPLSFASIPSEPNIIHNEDIDIKPVRLSSHSHSCRTSSQGSTHNKDNNNQSSSSDESHYSSHNSSPLGAVATGLKAALKSESNISETSRHRTSKQSNGLGFKGTRSISGDSLSDNEDNESDAEVCNSDKMSGSAQMPQKGVSIRLKDVTTPEETKASISNQSSLQDEDEDSEKEKTYKDKTETWQENDKENADIPRYSSEEEADKETDGSDDDAEQESTEESASSESEGGEDMEEEPVSNEDNGQKVDKTKTPEDSDSEDCIVSPQTRSKVIYVIPEHPSEHEASSRKTASSDDDQESSGSFDDIEQVLAPQENTQEDIKQPKFDDEANETCDIVARFCVKEERNKDHSDESDDFYD